MIAGELNLSGWFVVVPVLFVALGYTVSLVRDWRPMRSLRQENHDLRTDLNRASDRIHDLEAEVAVLRRERDLTPLQEDHRRIIETFERLVDKITGLDGAIRSNTAAIETIARHHAISSALDLEENGT